jgi:hypothetical protein
MKIDLRGVVSDLAQVRSLWKTLRAAREAGGKVVMRLAVGLPAADSEVFTDPWADVMPSRAARGDTSLCDRDCSHAEHQPWPVLAPQFHPVSEVDAERVNRGGFNPYTEPEWQAAARPLTPINEGN